MMDPQRHSQPWCWGSCDKASGSYSLWLADALPSAHLENHLPHRYLFKNVGRTWGRSQFCLGLLIPETGDSTTRPQAIRQCFASWGYGIDRSVVSKETFIKDVVVFGSPDDGFGCLELWNMFTVRVFFLNVCAAALWLLETQDRADEPWEFNRFQPILTAKSDHNFCIKEPPPWTLVFIWSRVKP